MRFSIAITKVKPNSSLPIKKRVILTRNVLKLIRLFTKIADFYNKYNYLFIKNTTLMEHLYFY